MVEVWLGGGLARVRFQGVHRTTVWKETRYCGNYSSLAPLLPLHPNLAHVLWTPSLDVGRKHCALSCHYKYGRRKRRYVILPVVVVMH